jgi:hypothetical protein
MKGCQREVEHILRETKRPAAARSWREHLAQNVRTEADQEQVREIDEKLNGWKQSQEDPASPERVWAISTLMRVGKEDKMQKLLQ